ncbi:MAG: glycoside hydrolase family 15 protein [Euzebyales bacterium]|jgi:GH15 family glucan-1,4-alpha-glucosidase|nr:glycoside hydrolase family 15 protein [Euzebyales bacterium]
MSVRPIADHALLSDCHSAALVASDGSVEWQTFPRFDSPSVFGRLLDEQGGHFRVGVQGEATVSRRYVDGSLVLETTTTTAEGTLQVTDALVVGVGERGHQLGRDAPHALLRHAACTRGRVRLVVEFAPRLEYGLNRPLLVATDAGVITDGGPDTLALSTDVDLQVDTSVATATVQLEAGRSASFALQWARAWERPPQTWDRSSVRDRLDDTLAAWSSWSAQHQRYDGPWRDLVRFSGAVLQGLTFQPTGAIVAAPTTSLPEVIGGSRNWDYRYSWLRDAAMTLDALWVAACPDEAQSFVEWLIGAAAPDLRTGEPIRIMYGVAGEHDLAERTLTHLSGWRDSAPVRVGNEAAGQGQLDVYGEVIDAVFRLREQLLPFDERTRRFLITLTDVAAGSWQEADQGIWEVRGRPRHYLHSKLLCWVALDRAVAMADDLGARAEVVQRWTTAREEIRTAILTRGYDEEVGAFTQSFGSATLDASALQIPLVGFLPGDDDRVRRTVAAIEHDLTDDRGFVRRYTGDDGLTGEEGAFLLCTFWLAQAHAVSGDVARARTVFEAAIVVRNDVDLLAEEYGSGQLLGNFPQAFSHVGLVNAAWAIAKAERGGTDHDAHQREQGVDAHP